MSERPSSSSSDGSPSLEGAPKAPGDRAGQAAGGADAGPATEPGAPEGAPGHPEEERPLKDPDRASGRTAALAPPPAPEDAHPKPLAEEAPAPPAPPVFLPPSPPLPPEAPPEKPSEEPTEAPRERRMSFMGHLMELRSRLIITLAAVALCIVLSMIFFEQIFAFLRAPLDHINEKFRVNEGYQALLIRKHLDPARDAVRMISTTPLDLFSILMKVALWMGLVLSSPIVLYEMWAFVAPGMKSREKRAIQPVLGFGILFFLGGASFCYYVVFPIMLEFLVWLDITFGIQPSYTPFKYIGLLLTFMLLFGAVFEIPLVAAVLARLRLLHPSWLTRFWRYVIISCFVLGALLSPGGELVSMLLMSGSLLFLYGLSIILTRVLYPKTQDEA